MSKIAFLYPGQGVQKAGMGADFYENSALAREIFDQAGECLKLDMKALCFQPGKLLDQTEYTQAALAVVYLAQTVVLTERGLKPDITAGLSLGEYAAIVAAGAMEAMDAVRLTRRRGILMQNAVPDGEGTMCAVLGMEPGKIGELLEKFDGATIANYNCPDQTVITGRKASVEAAAVRLKEAGAKRTIMLNVSGPFHSPMLVAAGEALAKELEQVQLQDPGIPYVTNVTAQKVETSAPIRDLLARQVSSPVRWMQSMELMLAEGVDCFVEIGPGRTLAGFLRKLDRQAKVYNVSSWEDVDKVTEELLQ